MKLLNPQRNGLIDLPLKSPFVVNIINHCKNGLQYKFIIILFVNLLEHDVHPSISDSAEHTLPQRPYTAHQWMGCCKSSEPQNHPSPCEQLFRMFSHPPRSPKKRESGLELPSRSLKDIKSELI